MSAFIMTLSAIFLVGLGGVLNFTSTEIAGRLGFTGMPAADVAFQMLAGTLLAIGAICWLSRKTVDGAVGKSIKFGNLMCYGVGAISLIRAASSGVLPPAAWLLGGVMAAFALAFCWLLFTDKSASVQKMS